jgi:hypothetical protein
MNPLQSEHESVSEQVDTIMKNRFRRFKYLMKHGRTEDAVAVGEEFTEWMSEELFGDEILYYREDQLFQACQDN